METKTSVIKELDTNQDTRRIEIGVQLWSEWQELNLRPLEPHSKRATKTALHPDNEFIIHDAREKASSFSQFYAEAENRGKRL